MLTRRSFLLGTGAAAGSMVGLGGYAFAVEPMLRLAVAEHQITPRGWPRGFHLKIASLPAIHAIAPWLSAERIAGIAAFTNTFRPDIVLLGGDYEAGLRRFRHLGRLVPMAECADALAVLRAPLGIHGVLGNHDIWTNNGD